MVSTLLVVLAFSTSTLAEAPAVVEHPSEALMKKLEGRWSCAGAFANGKSLKADLTFTRMEGGTGLRYLHTDRAPNAYRQEAFWGVDKKTGQLIATGFTGTSGKPDLNAVMYLGENMSDNSATFVHQRLLSDPFAPNRFIYSIEGGTLRMVWEVYRNNEWKMGDYLVCDPAPQSQAQR